VILIIAEPTDLPALWLRPRLAARVATAVATVSPIQLVCSRQIVHRLSDGGADSRFVLAGGAIIESSVLTGVVNRLGAAPTAHLARAPLRDRIYARDELHAFLLGWLASLECSTINRPEPDFLAGPWHPPLEALQLAALAGLPCRPRRLAVGEVEMVASETGPLRTHFVLDGQLVGPLAPAGLRDALLRFAALWGGRLVQVDFAVAGREPTFHAATSFVDYRLGGDLLVRALAGAFEP
jgi:hypothetical protein